MGGELLGNKEDRYRRTIYRLTELFDYNDPDAMISTCMERIQRGIEDIFILFEQDVLAGELHVMYQNDDERFAKRGKRTYLFAFRIRDEYQNQGYGTKLLQTVLALLQEKGYDEFTVGVEDNNPRAKHIYWALGFSEFICRKKKRIRQTVTNSICI